MGVDSMAWLCSFLTFLTPALPPCLFRQANHGPLSLFLFLSHYRSHTHNYALSPCGPWNHSDVE